MVVTGEIDTIYVDPQDRYIVSLIVGYSDENFEDLGSYSALDQRVKENPDKMLAAADAALELTRDGGRSGTNWYVFDRVTGKGRFIEQEKFDASGDVEFDYEVGYP